MLALAWIPATLLAALAQVGRNGLQAGLVDEIGTLGATQVRFIFGLPFALLILAAGRMLLGEGAPTFTGAAMGYALLGAVAQIAATALMLMAMARRSFGVAYAYIKTEPILVALFGLALLGDRLAAIGWAGIVIATGGILLVSIDPRNWRALVTEWRPMALGIAAGGGFGLSAVAFRGAITALEGGSAFNHALTIMTVSLAIQSLLLGAWLLAFDRRAFIGSLRVWRQSLGAGFLGALATAAWFVAFSLTAAANVRTLALAEMPAAALVSRKVSGRALGPREWVGLALVMGGIALMMAQAVR
ncbi:MAG: multidrug DMT transporter permease [Sphingobium sp. 66-54]|nr:MAG: multidrug DMT transporter permease [Sphingobium sp. 66-54]